MKLFPTAPGLWLSICVLAGIANMAFAGAPSHYMAINAGALAVALALIGYAPTIGTERAVTAVCIVAVLALGLPLLVGPEVEGIRRWIGLGPVKLHSGFLALPVLVALLPRLASAQAIVATALAAILISFQPDRASAIAFLPGTAALLFANRSATSAAQLLFAVLAVGATLMQPDSLESVAFVENILTDAWQSNPLWAVVLAAVLTATFVVPALGDQRLIPIAATFIGFALASFLGAYPVPLIGYGAAAILGFGAAIAIAAKHPIVLQL